MTLPNLAGVATADLVEKIGGGNFSAAYINWSRTLNLLRTHAPGWLPEVVPNNDGGLLHAAPVGCYLLIRFRNGDTATPPVPQAVMDQRNNAIPHDKITARDVTDTHRRGICMAAAMTFGLAYELWAKLPLESGFVEPEKPTGMAADIIADWLRYINDSDGTKTLKARLAEAIAAAMEVNDSCAVDQFQAAADAKTATARAKATAGAAT